MSDNEEFAEILSLVNASHTPTGSKNQLGAVLYEPGSDWDQIVKDAQAAGQDVYLEEDSSAVNLLTPTAPSNLTVDIPPAFRNASLIAGS